MDNKDFAQLTKFLEDCFAGLSRKSGGPMVVHSIEVASLLRDEGWDDITIIAGGTHDVLEDTKVPESELLFFMASILKNLDDALVAFDISKFCCYTPEEYTLPKADRKKVACARWISSTDPRVWAIKSKDVLSNKRSMHLVPQKDFAQNYLLWADPLETQLNYMLQSLSTVKP